MHTSAVWVRSKHKATSHELGPLGLYMLLCRNPAPSECAQNLQNTTLFLNLPYRDVLHMRLPRSTYSPRPVGPALAGNGL